MAKPTDKPKKMKTVEDVTSSYVPAPDEKEIMASKLCKAGFKARNEKGIVTVYYRHSDNYEEVCEAVKKEMSKCGYDKSWGLKPDTNMFKEEIIQTEERELED